MPGLNIQNSINNAINQGTQSITLHELFMDRYNEYYNTLDQYNDMTGQSKQAPRVTGIKSRLDQQGTIRQDQEQMTAEMATMKAKQAAKDKMEQKVKRGKRPVPKSADEIGRIVQYD